MASRSNWDFSLISRRNNGTLTVRTRWSEGEVEAKDERNARGELVSITRFRGEFPLLRIDVDIFDTPKTESQLADVFNARLALDTNRTPIDIRKIAARGIGRGLDDLPF